MKGDGWGVKEGGSRCRYAFAQGIWRGFPQYGERALGGGCVGQACRTRHNHPGRLRARGGLRPLSRQAS